MDDKYKSLLEYKKSTKDWHYNPSLNSVDSHYVGRFVGNFDGLDEVDFGKVQSCVDLYEGDEKIGSDILLNAIEKPFIQILQNAGIDKYHTILSKVERNFKGYNIQTEKYVDMIEEGIIDPTKVTRTALENAVSVAGTMLITECTIVDDPEEKTEEDPMSMMGM